MNTFNTESPILKFEDLTTPMFNLQNHSYFEDESTPIPQYKDMVNPFDINTPILEGVKKHNLSFNNTKPVKYLKIDLKDNMLYKKRMNRFVYIIYNKNDQKNILYTSKDFEDLIKYCDLNTGITLTTSDKIKLSEDSIIRDNFVIKYIKLKNIKI